MRVAIDTNVLVYAEGLGDEPRSRKAAALFAALNARNVVLPAQVLGELFNVLTRKAGRSPLLARDAVLSFTWQGLTAVNPFLASRHPLPTQLLAG